MLTDSIAALATPPGRSALALIRLSGKDAFDVARRVIEGFTPDPPRQARLAHFTARDGTVLDQGIYTTWVSPDSYTGEDAVELSCHGGLVVPSAVLAALQAAGARPAAPGEFTRRAVLNGKMDLLQAEAVGDLIDATAGLQARQAIHQLDGSLSRRLGQLREQLLQLQALLSYDVDFPEEDDGPVPAHRIAGVLKDATTAVRALLRTAPGATRLQQGALVVLAGRPNAGKSSLFNALLGTDRVLVSEVPGTTRDAVEASTDFEGWPVRLLDTAGLSDFTDTVDRLGVDMSRRYIRAADLVLVCLEATEGTVEPAELQDLPALVVRTKSDLARPGGPGIPVSVVTGEGLSEVRAAVAERIFGEGIPLADFEPVLTRERHRVGLERALEALELARPHLGAGGEAVLAAHHVREATEALDELIGSVDIDEVLDRVFRNFCVGK